jgi:hypothetical protein
VCRESIKRGAAHGVCNKNFILLLKAGNYARPNEIQKPARCMHAERFFRKLHTHGTDNFCWFDAHTYVAASICRAVSAFCAPPTSSAGDQLTARAILAFFCFYPLRHATSLLFVLLLSKVSNYLRPSRDLHKRFLVDSESY